MVAYTKDEEDYLFDIWKSVRKQDEDRGILNSSSNRQRYLKIYEAYKNQGYSRTYAQVETKLKKHRSSFIKTFNGGACTELNPTGCPRYQDLLDMFAELYRGSPYVANPIKVKEEPFSYLNLNGDSNIVFDPSELQEEGNNNGFLKELESIPLKNNSLDHSLDCNDGRMPRKLSYVNNLLPCKQACDRYTLGSPLPASHQQQTASQVHLPHQNQQLLKQQQRHQREIASTLQQIRDGNREHSRVLNQGLQMLAAAITKLVDSKLQISTGCVASPATSSPGVPPLPKKLSSADAELRDDDVDKCAFVDHAMIDRHDNDVHVPLVDNAQCDEDDDPMPLVGVGQCDDDEIDDEIDDVNN